MLHKIVPAPATGGQSHALDGQNFHAPTPTAQTPAPETPKLGRNGDNPTQLPAQEKVEFRVQACAGGQPGDVDQTTSYRRWLAQLPAHLARTIEHTHHCRAGDGLEWDVIRETSTGYYGWIVEGDDFPTMRSGRYFTSPQQVNDHVMFAAGLREEDTAAGQEVSVQCLECWRIFDTTLPTADLNAYACACGGHLQVVDAPSILPGVLS